MKKSNQTEKKSWLARLRMAVAAVALAGALAGGVSMSADVDPVEAEDTTETAWGMVKSAPSETSPFNGARGFSRGVSWM